MIIRCNGYFVFFFFSSRRRHTRYWRDWSSDVCSSDLVERYMLETIYLRHFFLSHGAGIYPVGSVLTKLYFGRREVVFIFPPAAVIRLIVTCEAQSGNLLGRRHVDDNGLCLAIGTVIAQLSAIGEVAIKEF